MHCPKCGAENPDDSKLCRSCNWDLKNLSQITARSFAKTCSPSVAALILWMFSALLVPLPRKYTCFEIFLMISAVIGVGALFMGVVGLASIKASPSWPRGKGLAIAGVVVPAAGLIIMLLGVLTPPRPPHRGGISQKNQFHGLEAALELFNAEFDACPSSDALDPSGQPYCGAMKLCEAMMGQDLEGFNPDSIFRGDGLDSPGVNDLYPDINQPSPEGYAINIKCRKGPYLPLESANAYRLKDIYGTGKTRPFRGDLFVLCDIYCRVTNLGSKGRRRIGMPVLYYKANKSKTAHDLTDPNNPENIYNYKDNHALVGLGVPWEPGKKHPLFTNPEIFYKMTKDKKASTKTKGVPHRADSFILISAGFDGMYGTKDDIVNFER